MANGYKLYLDNGKYKILNESKLIDIAKKKLIYKDILRKKYSRKEINKVDALTICQLLKIQIEPLDVMEIESDISEIPELKAIECMEEDIQNFIFDYIKKQKEEDVEKFIIKDDEEYISRFNPYFSGSRNAMLSILKDDLHYQGTEENKITVDYFIDKEVYLTSNISYKKNIITVELTKDKFIYDFNARKIYKYKASIIDEAGYQFNFKKDELFISREAAILESKKLVDEHYNLRIKNSKIQRIIVRTDDKGTIIVFWPTITTKDDSIISNDIIGTTDLAGELNTSLAFFHKCKNATEEEIQIAKKVIENCMNLKTFNVKNL